MTKNENEICMFYIPSDIAYIAMGATISRHNGATATAASIAIGIGTATSYIHNTNYFAELIIAST